jgi:hypothetical protein
MMADSSAALKAVKMADSSADLSAALKAVTMADL